MAKHPGVEMSFAMTGGVPIRLAMLENQASNVYTFQLIGYGMILGMAIILFRGFTVVMVVAAAPAPTSAPSLAATKAVSPTKDIKTPVPPPKK